ncbi:MAG TPA: nucleotide pyrophosphohydrolase [Gemmatimonadaceae bacterium]|nr:nucleotide pyrophosphohydrolase [Gemmatimonadaceae bacterium]
MSGEMNLDALQDAVVNFAHEREWEQFHDAKNLCMALASEVGELNAVLRWVRNDEVDAVLTDERVQKELRQEIGDVGILLILLCARTGISLKDTVLEKLEMNKHKYPVSESRGLSNPPRDIRQNS